MTSTTVPIDQHQYHYHYHHSHHHQKHNTTALKFSFASVRWRRRNMLIFVLEVFWAWVLCVCVQCESFLNWIQFEMAIKLAVLAFAISLSQLDTKLAYLLVCLIGWFYSPANSSQHRVQSVGELFLTENWYVQKEIGKTKKTAIILRIHITSRSVHTRTETHTHKNVGKMLFNCICYSFMHSQSIGLFLFSCFVFMFMLHQSGDYGEWSLSFSFEKHPKNLNYIWKNLSLLLHSQLFMLSLRCFAIVAQLLPYFSFHFFVQIRFLSVFVPFSFHPVLRVHMTNFLPHNYCRYASHTTCMHPQH